MRRMRPHRRHGVLLLIVLCVLFMFLLLAITYTVVASKERTITRNYARFERSGDPPNVVCDQIAMMIFRDTNDPHSPFRGLSLEEGIWGNVSFRGTLSGAPTPQAGGQFLNFAPTGTNINGTAVTFNTTPNYYKGCVLTMLTGQCAGLSTRIVASASGSVTVMRFQADAGLYDPASGDTFLINGRAYCGMGRGYNTSANIAGGEPANDAMDPNGWPYALLLNPVGFQPSATYNNGSNDPSGPGGANMDYTAWDNNNPFLALMLNNTTLSQSGILPSFFRPDLYNYWQAQVPGLATNATLLRKISFRPNSIDHPAFVANTNPNFNPGNPASQFDVDNLGGGVADSVWMDPGLPAITMRDGRTAKIIVATCILDLDGRVNVNAHGSVLNTDLNVSPTAQTGSTATCAAAAAMAGLPSGGTVLLPIGQGYGPADVNLNGIFSQAEVKAIIEGIAGTAPSVGWSGRYGGSPGSTFSAWSNTNKPLELIKLFEFPIVGAQTDNPLAVLTSFGTPPDLKGRRMVALDERGQPIFITPGATANNTNYWTNEVQGRTTNAESPYCFNLSRSEPRPGRYISGTTIDNKFTVGELEPILRQYDVDVRSCPQRLISMLPSVQPGSPTFNANQRNRFTTESFDLPSPNFQAPRNLRAALSSLGFRAYGITDLLNAKLASTGVGANANAEIAKLIPPELIAGLRMDINRPFGNGRGDNANTQIPVDSPGGISSNNPSAPDANPETLFAGTGSFPEPTPNAPGTSGYTGPVPMNLVNGSNAANGLDPVLSNRLPPGHQARQLMARHLYALMMLFADQGFTQGWINPTELSNNPALAAPGSTIAQQLTARRIAQWAINAVSFRDSTSIMTPFMYHWDIYQPSYKGWTVDGDPGNQSQNSNGNIGVVWSCKPPDAVLTETIAFHDKRIADTAWDSGNSHKIADMPPDSGGASGKPNFDQTRIPQGSLFLEINCTRNPNTPFAPTDLYTKNASGQYCLDLGRMAPDGNPVWRMAISQSRISSQNADMLTQTSKYPETTTFEPTTDPAAAGTMWQQMNLFNAGQNVPIERIVWLGSTPPTVAQRQNLAGWSPALNAQIYYNRTGSVLVPPGSYAVIGPRATTYVGAGGTFTSGAGQWGKPSLQKITVTPTVTLTDPNGVSTMPAATGLKSGSYAAVGMVCAADPPPAATWTNAAALAAQTTAGIGLNVSEPLPASGSYYPQPTVANPSLPGIYDAYDDLTQTTASAQKYLDQPIEEIGSPYAAFPLMKDAIYKTATTQNYRTVFLQRLADPTSGYDALRNPYITVDWMPIDLTVFNGEDLPTNPNPNDPNAAAPNVIFTTRQRGGSNPQALPNPPSYNLWTPLQAGDSLGAPTTATALTGTHTSNFPYKLNHTLGYLNQAFGTGMITGTTAGAALAPQYVGDPQHPFPWITWNARPYATPLELLNVPASSPDRLLFEFNAPGTLNPATPGPFITANVYDPSNPTNVRAPFNHLLNFFNSSTSTYAPGSSWNLYRVLDYLQVPSRFVGCETYLNPSVFTASGGGGAATQYFLPPFNYVSNYRDPGKMNINTITDAGVLSAFLNGSMGTNSSQFFAALNDSRRCDGASSGVIINPATTLPTYFGNPIRSAAGADLVPIQAMMHCGVNATLLRAGSSTPDGATVPLFAANTSVNDYNSATRNSYFAYQGLERIANNVTTRSNVFGVWLTIGYFEVVPWGSVDAGHPDGYQLGEEIGSDTGEVERHRAFYIFDRSIPVGYERGQNHNVNRAILLKRYIE
jgi:hypothetical protein